VDLGPDVTDIEIGSAALEAADHRPDDRDEGRLVSVINSCGTSHGSIASSVGTARIPGRNWL
jgi:hypothetical protein